MNKQEQWDAAWAEATTITDALGRHIDPGIFETVVVLRLLGFTTEQSCEGHMDHGRSFPWVTITSQADYQEALVLFKQGDTLRKEGRKEEAYALYAKARTARNIADEQHAQETAKMLAYLEAFYASRPLSYDRHLIVYGSTLNTDVLESQGASIQTARSEEQRQQYLQAYQEEMQAFTQFLKACFFEAEDAPQHSICKPQ